MKPNPLCCSRVCKFRKPQFVEGENDPIALVAQALCLVWNRSGKTRPPRRLRIWPQSYPNRPVRLIVSSGAGGGADFMGRVVALKLSRKTGRYAMVVDNRGGAGGIIGRTRLVAKATPDGYTLGLGNNTTHVMAPVFNRRAPFIRCVDFTPISVVSQPRRYLVAATMGPGPNGVRTDCARRRQTGYAQLCVERIPSRTLAGSCCASIPASRQ